MTSFSGFAFLMPTLIITETDLQQLLCTCTCLSSRGGLLSHGKGVHVGSIWSIAYTDPFKASKSLFEPLLFCSVCVCVLILFTEIIITNTLQLMLNPTAVPQMLSASFCEVRSSFTILFLGFTLSVKCCSVAVLLLSPAHLHWSMVLKIFMKYKIGSFKQKKPQDTKESSASNEKGCTYSLSATVHKRT